MMTMYGKLKLLSHVPAYVWLCLLIGSLVFSAVGVVYSNHLNRHLFSQLQKLDQLEDALEVEWSQLLLEKSTWNMPGRIERTAREKLNMQIPAAKDIVLVRVKP